MVLILVEGANALRVHDETLEGLTFAVGELDRLGPYPETLRAWVDRGSNAKAPVVLV